MGGWPNTQVFLGTDPIEITFDLNDQFESIPPGEYDLIFRWDGENKALSESRVVVAKFESASSFMCEGIKYTEEMSAGRSRNGVYSFRCKLDIGEVSSGNEKQSWSLLAKTMKAAEPKNKFIEFKPFTSTVNLPEEGRVINAMVDYKCRLWILVECAEKQALFTWKVGHGIPIEETIGWGSPIKLSSTVASPVSVGRFLVAGRKGEQQVSSSSLSFSAVKKKKE